MNAALYLWEIRKLEIGEGRRGFRVRLRNQLRDAVNEKIDGTIFEVRIELDWCKRLIIYKSGTVSYYSENDGYTAMLLIGIIATHKPAALHYWRDVAMHDPFCRCGASHL